MGERIDETWYALLKRAKTLSKAEEKRLLKRMRAGDSEARELLVMSQLRYVTSIATKCQGRGIPLDDLIQAGVLGLLRALETFDGSYRLSTYATQIVYHKIHTEIAEGKSVIRVNKSARRRKEWQESLPELSKRIIAGNIVSLDDSATDPKTGSTRRLLSMVKQSREPRPDADAMLREDIGLLKRGLAALSERESEVLLRRANSETLEDVSASIGCTRERVRQIEKQALGKIQVCLGAGAVPVASLCKVNGKKRKTKAQMRTRKRRTA
jgi:RNA polymerase sigma factor (sigma-70 family)